MAQNISPAAVYSTSALLYRRAFKLLVGLSALASLLSALTMFSKPYLGAWWGLAQMMVGIISMLIGFMELIAANQAMEGKPPSLTDAINLTGKRARAYLGNTVGFVLVSGAPMAVLLFFMKLLAWAPDKILSGHALLSAFVILGLAMMLFCLVCPVWYLIFFIRCSLYGAVVASDFPRTHRGLALSESWYLMKGYFWKGLLVELPVAATLLLYVIILAFGMDLRTQQIMRPSIVILAQGFMAIIAPFYFTTQVALHRAVWKKA